MASILLGRTAAAHRLGVSERTIDRYVERGLLVRRKDPVGGRSGIEVTSIEAIERGRVVISA